MEDEFTLERLRQFALSVDSETSEILLKFISAWEKRQEDVHTFSNYQTEARLTRIYPDRYKIIYPALGLANEAGEVAGAVKKLMRDGQLDVTKTVSEMGDTLWYLSNLASDLQITLRDIAWTNLLKLRRRQANGTIGGSGDR